MKQEQTESQDTGLKTEPSITNPEENLESIPNIENLVLEKICEKTGYERSDLDLDFELEADLGIDTVKQAELFAELKEELNIEEEPQALQNIEALVLWLKQHAQSKTSKTEPSTHKIQVHKQPYKKNSPVIFEIPHLQAISKGSLQRTSPPKLKQNHRKIKQQKAPPPNTSPMSFSI